MAEGLPVGFVVPEPVIVGQFGASVMAKAPNPNAARLMAGYLASVDGKRQREKATYQSDYGPTADNALARKICTAARCRSCSTTVNHGRSARRLFGRLPAS